MRWDPSHDWDRHVADQERAAEEAEAYEAMTEEERAARCAQQKALDDAEYEAFLEIEKAAAQWRAEPLPETDDA